MQSRPYRFIIVGAGSAGCVLAHRLSADPDSRVLLLEAGGRDRNPFIHMPAGLAKLIHNRQINWRYYTEPQCELHDRRLYWPRGKVLGGSSSINAMCYIRGQAQDYDDWARAGNEGWHFDSVLPHFKKSERQQHGPSEFHGAEGPLSVEDLRHRNVLTDVFVAAGIHIGLPRNDDFNGPSQIGVGPYQVTQRGGRRWSAAAAYLVPAARRRNLTVATGSMAERIVTEHGRAVALEYRHEGKVHTAHCSGEILLCGGSINSPQLLMLSGIGDARHLRALDIPVVADLPGVGANLQDHLDVCTLYRSTQPVSYDFGRLAELRVACQYLLRRSGPGVSNIAEAGGFAQSIYAKDGRPDIQFHFVPAQLDDHGRNRLPGYGFTLHACYLRPRSRGHLQLRSTNADEPPLIHANYLHDGHDLDVMVDAVRMSREILNAAPFDPFRGSEVFPGAAVRSTSDVVDFIRRKAETIYHPVGTCRMGHDELAVVDPQLRVRGVHGLRVVDASIMPTLVSGNTNAPVIMIAEKAADSILAATPAPHPCLTSATRP